MPSNHLSAALRTGAYSQPILLSPHLLCLSYLASSQGLTSTQRYDICDRHLDHSHDIPLISRGKSIFSSQGQFSLKLDWTTHQVGRSVGLSMRSSPLATQSTDKRTAHLSPGLVAGVQDPPIIPSLIRVSETLSEFWPSEHRFSGSVTTSEPLSSEGVYLPSDYDTAGLSDQNESTSSLKSPSTVVTDIERTSPTTPVLAGVDPAHPAVISNKAAESNIASAAHGRQDLLTSTPPSTEAQSFTGNSRFLHHTPQPTRRAVLRAALPLFQSSLSLPPTQSRLPNPLASTLARDTLLTYAHRIFKSPFQPTPGLAISPVVCEPSSPQHPYNTQLLPLLRNLKLLHPKHIPILLLLGCVCHAVGDYAGSLEQNQEILNIDENFVSELQFLVHEQFNFFSEYFHALQVEAMSNIGTSLKAMGYIDDAERWWWKAISLKPTYWDAIVGT